MEDWLYISPKYKPSDLNSRGVIARGLVSNDSLFESSELVFQVFSQWYVLREVSEGGSVQVIIHSETILTTSV